MHLLQLILFVAVPLAVKAGLSKLSEELLDEGLIWLNAEKTPSTMCMVTAKNGSSYAESCAMTDGFMDRSVGCFAVWNRVGMISQGCYSGQEISLRDQCTRGACVGAGKKGKQAVGFCCCHGPLCNNDHS